MKFNSPVDEKLESRVTFKTAPMVIVPKKGSALPEVFGFEVNGVERCPNCGRKVLSTNGAAKWPWHAVIYRIQSESLSFHCAGTLIKSNSIITAGLSSFFVRHSGILKIYFLSSLRHRKRPEDE